MEEKLTAQLENESKTILPNAELCFNSFNVLSPGKIKVVFIGQDPYVDVEKINGKYVPQATGFAFSIPVSYPKNPPSLVNIYKNMIEFGHLKKMPATGCLANWILQGCFMINAALTTIYGEKNAHSLIWKNFTDDLLKYLNDNFENLVFVVWGKFAHNICLNIDPNRHHIITSSHPSPLGFDKTFEGKTYGMVKRFTDRKTTIYASFKSTDHFGRINQYLKSVGKSEIIWDLINYSFTK